MVRFYLVDDEDVIREGMRDCFPWERFEAEVVGTAANGQSALGEILSLTPDVVFTDIVMPRMDGVTLSRRLREEGFAGEIVFFSAHQEMDYAKAALKLAAADFLFKPIQNTEMEETVGQMVERVRRKIEQKLVLEEAKHVREEQALQEKKQLWRQLLSDGQPVNRENFPGGLIMLYSALLPEDAVCRHVRAFLESSCTVWELVCNLQEGYGLSCVILKCRGEGLPPPEALCAFDKGLKDKLEKEDANAFIRTGFCTDCGMQLPELCRSYIEELGNKLLQEPGPAAGGKGKPSKTGKSSWGDTLGEEMLNGSQDAVKKHLRNFFWERFTKNAVNLPGLKNDCVVLCYAVSSFLKGALAEEQLQIFVQNSGALENTARFDELYNKLEGAVIALYNRIQPDVGSIRVVQQVKALVAENLAEAGAERLAYQVKLSKNYLAVLFKKHTGLTLNDYITGERMKKAAALLQGGSMYIYEVSAAVGYRDIPYFTKLFRQRYGCLPGEYKEGPKGGRL